MIQNSKLETQNYLEGQSLLCLLQLASPNLPVGAYSYSEGLESLADAGKLDSEYLKDWLEQELRCGAIRLDAAVMVRAYRAVELGDLEALTRWNAWLCAAMETEELRQQSWQMGQSLVRLLLKMQKEKPKVGSLESLVDATGLPCFAIAFGLAAAYWQIDSPTAVLLGYLHSWATNLVAAGVKLIPLGQTAGQQLLLGLHDNIVAASEEILTLEDDDLSSCSWGRSLASMAHETQYTRLFRS